MPLPKPAARRKSATKPVTKPVTKPAATAGASPHGTQGWLSVVRAYNLCEAAIGASLAELGLRLGEHEVLVNLATSAGLTQQELAARCFVAKSGVSMLLKQLEGKGWVLREDDAADARIWRLSLTARGLAVAARCLKIQADLVHLMVDDASEAELATVTEVMQRMSARLEDLLAQPSTSTTPASRSIAALRVRR